MSQGRFRAAPFSVVFDGQSLNVSPGSPNSYPEQLMADYASVTWRNVAVSGESWTTLSTSVSTRLNPYAKAALTSILVMCGGYSDIVSDGDTGQQLYDQEVTYANNARTAGFDKIIGTTLVKANNMTAGQNTARENHNTLLLADASAAFDDVVDLAGNANLSDPTNLTYYNADGIHWVTAGAAVAASLVAVALEAISGFPAAS